MEDKAADEYIQFSAKDRIDVVPFSYDVIDVLTSTNPTDNTEILAYLNKSDPYGSTALHPAIIKALEILEKSPDNYNKSIVVMTDGYGNVGTFGQLESEYNKKGNGIPIYSIMFGDASESQLNEIARLSNGKVFDGKTDLIEAFKEVRGYN